eukprot:15431283-Alexandrium_andersonii.AAC.1
MQSAALRLRSSCMQRRLGGLVAGLPGLVAEVHVRPVGWDGRLAAGSHCAANDRRSRGLPCATCKCSCRL